MLKTCALTGHGAMKLPWGLDEEDKRCMELKFRMNNEIKKAIRKGYAHFIFGISPGCDIYFAESVLQLKYFYQHIDLECVISFEKPADSWSTRFSERYFAILKNCTKQTLISDECYQNCPAGRNKYMVDKSDYLIAAYIENDNGLTKRTIDYAQDKGRVNTIIKISGE